MGNICDGPRKALSLSSDASTPQSAPTVGAAMGADSSKPASDGGDITAKDRGPKLSPKSPPVGFGFSIANTTLSVGNVVRDVKGMAGLAASGAPRPMEESFPLPTNRNAHFVVEIIGATAVPQATSMGIADPFVSMHMEDSSGNIKGNKAFTLPKRHDIDPVWHSYRDLQAEAVAGDFLVVELFDFDAFGQHDLLGSVHVPVASIREEADTFEVTPLYPQTPASPAAVAAATAAKSSEPTDGDDTVTVNVVVPTCTVTLRRAAAPLTTRKTLFLVRHGESFWNQAQEEKNIINMIAFDHGLNATGIQQAEQLREAWSSSSSSASDAKTPTEMEKKFVDADAVFTSPLTRAVQTAIVALHTHPRVVADGITVLSNVREIKNAGSLDSVGVAVGDGIALRAQEGLAKVVGDEKAQSMMPTVHANDAVAEWWTATNMLDTAYMVNLRFVDFLWSLRCLPHDSSIVVGHSLFIRELCQLLMSESVRKLKPELAGDVTTKKLSNGGVLALEIEFGAGVPRLEDVELLFGSTFV